MRHSISETAEYGDYSRGPRIIDADTKARMKQILGEIQSGSFAKEFILEKQAGNVAFEALRKQGAEHPMEEVGARLRDLMPWLRENGPVDRTEN